jgi:hypothetical protein
LFLSKACPDEAVVLDEQTAQTEDKIRASNASLERTATVVIDAAMGNKTPSSMFWEEGGGACSTCVAALYCYVVIEASALIVVCHSLHWP